MFSVSAGFMVHVEPNSKPVFFRNNKHKQKFNAKSLIGNWQHTGEFDSFAYTLLPKGNTPWIFSSEHFSGSFAGVLANVEMFLRVLNHMRNYSLKIGDKVSVKRQITLEDVKAFANVTKDHNPIHFDPEKGIVHGAFLNGLVSGVIGTVLPGAGTVVVHQDLRFPKPCYVGSEVTIDVEVKSVRKIIEVEFQVYNGSEFHEEQVVLEGSAKLLIPFHKDSMKFQKEPNSYGHNYINC